MKNETSDINQNDQFDVITVTDNQGKEHPFELVLCVPFEEKEYAILHPLDKYPGLDEDSCAIFELITHEGSDEADLIPETDDDILDSVYALYVEWATEQQQNEEKEAKGCTGSCAGCHGCDND